MTRQGEYPNMTQVEKATKFQLGRWMRFLPSPGAWAVGKDHFEQTMAGEKIILDRIAERFEEMGGMSPGLSKEIGWQ